MKKLRLLKGGNLSTKKLLAKPKKNEQKKADSLLKGKVNPVSNLDKIGSRNAIELKEDHESYEDKEEGEDGTDEFTESSEIILDPEIISGDIPIDLDDDAEEISNGGLGNVLPIDLENFDEDESDLNQHLEVRPKKPSSKLSAAKDIIRYDPLEAYLREINQFGPLTKEEEKSIAVNYYQHKDVDSAYKLVSSNLWLVVKIARDYEKAARNILDLIQEGNIGLLEAVKNFDPYREVRFPSYAVWWIKAYIIRFVIANWRLVKIGTTQAQRKLFFNLSREKERLEKEGFYPGPKLIASNLNVRESDVIEMEQRLGGSDMSVDTPTSEDSEYTLMNLLSNNQLNGEEILAEKERMNILKDSMNEFSLTLSEKERAVFEERLLGEEKVTLNDLADRYSLSRERIRQIENKVKEKLKKFLVGKYGASLENMT